MKTRVAFLSSGSGANLALAIAVSRLPGSDLEIVFVAADRDCGAIEIARRENVESTVFEFPQSLDAVAARLHELNVDVVVTTFHKVLPARFVGLFAYKLVNLHYSLLPNLRGTIGNETLIDSYHQNTLIAGITVHLVDETLDGGPQIAQAAVIKQRFKNFDDFAAAVTLLGAFSLISVMEKWKKIRIGSRNDPLDEPNPMPSWVISSRPISLFDSELVLEFEKIYGKKTLWSNFLLKG